LLLFPSILNIKQYLTIGSVGWTMFGSRLAGAIEWSTAGPACALPPKIYSIPSIKIGCNPSRSDSLVVTDLLFITEDLLSIAFYFILFLFESSLCQSVKFRVFYT
jgi:hypothetical protein